MELTADQLEWIVREVVRRLRATGVGVVAESGSAAAGELTLADRVITARQLDDRLTGIARLRIAKTAVVTPSARDLLSDRGIELLRET